MLHLLASERVRVLGYDLHPLGENGQVGDVDHARVGTIHASHLKRICSQLVRAENVPRHVSHHQRHWRKTSGVHISHRF